MGPAQKILKGDKRALAKGITLLESTLPQDKIYAQKLLDTLRPHTQRGLRLGITGVPGVGKSTFIEAFGMKLLKEGKKIAVLTIDPSSPISGGSLLGDKTRMEELARQDHAFIRPSPSAGHTGGVSRTTEESIFLCEAAGHKTVLVETVGVGQSEYEVASMVDLLILLMLPNAGDELQGMKRGIFELADIIAINKADGDNKLMAEKSRQHYQNALSISHSSAKRDPAVFTCSSLEGDGINQIWMAVQEQLGF